MSLIRKILDTKFWEPEEAVGTLWDSCVDRLDPSKSHPDAAVSLAQVKGALGVLFRGLGGETGVEIKAGGESLSHHRRAWRRRFAREAEKIETARFDGLTLFLPEKIDAFPSAGLNRDLYLWLAAFAVAARPCEGNFPDPLRRDIARLRQTFHDCEQAVELFPGLVPLRRALGEQTLRARQAIKAPPLETEVENWIRARLAGEPLTLETPLERALAGDESALHSLCAPSSYKTYRPVLMWGERAPAPSGSGRRRDDDTPEPGGSSAEGAEKTLKAERRKSDQAERRDSLILHRFEFDSLFRRFSQRQPRCRRRRREFGAQGRRRRGEDRRRPSPQEAPDAAEIRSRSVAGGRRPREAGGTFRLSGMGLEKGRSDRRSGARPGKRRC